VNEAELLTIAKQDTSRYTVVDDFGSLDTNLIATLSSKICVQPVGDHFLAVSAIYCVTMFSLKCFVLFVR